jgi:succinoglycan biosynthesis transport protein ExoP
MVDSLTARLKGVGGEECLSETDGMRFRDLVAAVRRRWLRMLICVALGAGIGYGASRLQKREFRSTTTVYMTEAHTKFLSPLLVKAYADAAATTSVLMRIPGGLTASQTAQLTHNPAAVVVPPDANLVTFTLLEPTGAAAARAVQAAATAFQSFVYQSSRAAVRVTIVQPALIAAAPVTPRTKRNILLGVLIGLLLGAFLSVRRAR